MQLSYRLYSTEAIRFIRSWGWGRVARVVFSPFAKLAVFFGLMAPIFWGGSTESLVPLMQPAIELLQNYFGAPSGYSTQEIFIPKSLKIFTITFFLVVRSWKSIFLGEMVRRVRFFWGFCLVVWLFWFWPSLYLYLCKSMSSSSISFSRGCCYSANHSNFNYFNGRGSRSVRQISPSCKYFLCLLVVSGIWRYVLFSGEFLWPFGRLWGQFAFMKSASPFMLIISKSIRTSPFFSKGGGSPSRLRQKGSFSSLSSVLRGRYALSDLLGPRGDRAAFLPLVGQIGEGPPEGEQAQGGETNEAREGPKEAWTSGDRWKALRGACPSGKGWAW